MVRQTCSVCSNTDVSFHFAEFSSSPYSVAVKTEIAFLCKECFPTNMTADGTFFPTMYEPKEMYNEPLDLRYNRILNEILLHMT